MTLLFLLGVAFAEECGPCDPKRCNNPRDCVAGVVKDKCGCCWQCGMKEGQLCNSNDLKCGDDLECLLRNDTPDDVPQQAVCQCKYTEILCGENGKTYKNLCHLMEEAYASRQKIKIARRGACKSAPWIASPPDDVVESLGNDVALSCEGMGYPIPVFEWTFIGSDGETVYLPKDDDHVAIQTRGGPESYEITSWVQIQGLRREDEGVYTCHASNELGIAEASAQVSISSTGPWEGV